MKRQGYPSREEAEKILREGEPLNPGKWGDHCRYTALCAERIARVCGLDTEKAYVLGLLHDIGRRFGVRNLGHVSDGYRYMKSLGYDEAARICLTHSFHNREISDYIGTYDTDEEELKLIEDNLSAAAFDDYDRLIQLCDCFASGEGIIPIEERIADIERRYGKYPVKKRQKIYELKRYFDDLAGRDVFEAVKADEVHSVPDNDTLQL